MKCLTVRITKETGKVNKSGGKKKFMVNKWNKNIKKKERPAIRNDASRLNWRKNEEMIRKKKESIKQGEGQRKLERGRAMK